MVEVIRTILLLITVHAYVCSASCNRTLFAEDNPKNFTSPNYPNNYNNDEFCYWDIFPSSVGYIVLDMVYSNIEPGPYAAGFCSNDRLSVFSVQGNIGDGNKHLEGTACGTQRLNIISSNGSSCLHITFQTNSAYTARGFLIRYHQSHDDTLCSEHYKAKDTEAEIYTPGYPNRYYPQQSCTWTITAPSGVILLEVLNSDLYTPVNGVCRTVVAVWNGKISRDHLLGKFCSNDKPVFLSSGKELIVQFMSGHNVAKGTKMMYKNLNVNQCQETLIPTPRNITLFSPGFPDVYYSNLNCSWKLLIPKHRGWLILDVLVRGNDSMACNENGVYLDYSENGNTVGKSMSHCTGREQFTVDASNITSVDFRYETGPNNTDYGFQLTYSFQEYYCGPTHLNASLDIQYLISPGYPDPYGKNLDCTWTISVTTPDAVVQIVVEDFKLEPSSNCEYDYLNVYDGSSIHCPLVNSWCGSMMSSAQSSGKTLTLLFHSDDVLTKKGFKLEYFQTDPPIVTTQRPRCQNQQLTAYSWAEYLSSPGYPTSYMTNLHCSWTIAAASYLSVVRIVVTDSHLEGTPCFQDYVMVYDGPNDYSPLLKRWCGYEQPTVQSSGQYLTLYFHTDGSYQFKGFKLKYFFTSGEQTTVNPSSCGHTYLSAFLSNNTLTSPGYPRVYSDDMDCTWVISAEVGYMVRIIVVDSHLEYEANCGNDYVKVYDGNGVSGTLRKTWCSYMEPTVQSTGRYMTLRFHTDHNVVYRGFKLVYFQTMKHLTCSRSLDATYSPKSLSSPGYPSNYQNNMDCTWTIRASSGNIKVRVNDLSIESVSGCYGDYVTAYDGSVSLNSKLGRLCGTDKPTFITSSSILIIQFHSDSDRTYKGFSMTYQRGTYTDCGLTSMTAYSYNDYLYSPNYPVMYPKNSDCSWLIEALSSTQFVELSVETSDIGDAYPCSTDYIEAFDGEDGSSPSLGTWCSSSTPLKQSRGQYMFLVFHSSTRTGKFSIKYSSKDSSTDSSTHAGTIAGCVIGIGAVVFIAACCLAASRRSSRRNRNAAERDIHRRPQTEQTRTNNTSNSEQGTVIFRVISLDSQLPESPGVFTPPPAYSELAKDNPPTYVEVIAAGGGATPLTDLRINRVNDDDRGIDNPAMSETELNNDNI